MRTPEREGRKGGKTYLAKREQDPLEERRRFINTLLERHISMHAKLVTLPANLFPHFLEQDLLVEALGLLGVQVGREEPRGRVRRVRGPVLWVREHHESGPHGERREDLECFGEGPRLVP